MPQRSRVPACGTGLPDAGLDGWCRLINQAQHWHEVHAILDNPVLDEAMALLKHFREYTHLNTISRGRGSFASERGMIGHELRDAKAEVDAEHAAKAAALAATEAGQVGTEAALARAAALATELAALPAKLGA